jgi:hypothetical protein
MQKQVLSIIIHNSVEICRLLFITWLSIGYYLGDSYYLTFVPGYIIIHTYHSYSYAKSSVESHFEAYCFTDRFGAKP